jgi:centromere protein I
LLTVDAAAKLPPKARLTSIKPTVESLASAAYQSGLLPDALQDLVALVTNTSGNHLDQANLASIVRNLYPVTRVSRQIVLRVVASLGHGSLKPSLNIQAALIRWLILVYHVLETPATLSQAYQVLFGLLDTAATRYGMLSIILPPFTNSSLIDLSSVTCWPSLPDESMSSHSGFKHCELS